MPAAGQFVASHRIWVAVAGAAVAAIVAVVLWQVIPGGSASNAASVRQVTPSITPGAQAAPLVAPSPTAVATDGAGLPTDQATATPSATESTASTASGEAADIQLILTASAATRATLVRALPDMEACGDIRADVDVLQAAAQSRADLLRRTAGLSADLLPSGAVMLADLRRALSASMVADESYAAWGTTLLREQPCNGNGAGDPNWAAAKAADVRATSAKSAFVAVWNAVAAQLGVAAIQASQF